MANAKLTQAFDENEPYAEIFGKPGYKFLQKGVYFNNKKEAVGKDPDYKPPKIQKVEKAPKQPKVLPEVQTRTTVMPGGLKLPDIQQEVQKENKQAAHAERLADG